MIGDLGKSELPYILAYKSVVFFEIILEDFAIDPPISRYSFLPESVDNFKSKFHWFCPRCLYKIDILTSLFNKLGKARLFSFCFFVRVTPLVLYYIEHRIPRYHKSLWEVNNYEVLNIRVLTQPLISWSPTRLLNNYCLLIIRTCPVFT